MKIEEIAEGKEEESNVKNQSQENSSCCGRLSTKKD